MTQRQELVVKKKKQFFLKLDCKSRDSSKYIKPILVMKTPQERNKLNSQLRTVLNRAQTKRRVMLKEIEGQVKKFFDNQFVS
mmetsp:Transcript_6764/g.7565  ORF Transcript_6764/g.7565 Transcript_6764/m.7565 type:complete len:82 (+) Transcript_6764:880-1125(+)